MRTMKKAWRLLGFDARLTDHDNEPLPEDMRRQYLLRPEILRPLSVDPHIWPAPFNSRVSFGISIDWSKKVREDTFHFGLWSDLYGLVKRLEELQSMPQIIAVELWAPIELTVADYPSELIYADLLPSVVPPTAELLGFDVADSGLWSGLSNCGYTKEEFLQLAPVWGPKINDLGLLRTLDESIVFRDITNCVWQLHLAHFGSLIWPTPGLPF